MTEEEYAAEMLVRIAAVGTHTLTELGGQIGLAHVQGLISDETALYLTGQIDARVQRQRLAAAEKCLASFLPPRVEVVAKPPRPLERGEAKRQQRREKRRYLAKVSAIPAALIYGFPPACQAVLAIIGQTCWKLGACEFPVAWIAQAANCSVRTVQNTLTLAKRRGLITVLYRRRMTSVVRVAHKAWLDWWERRSTSSKTLDSSSVFDVFNHSLKGAKTEPPHPDQGDLFEAEEEAARLAQEEAEWEEEYEREKREKRERPNFPPVSDAARKWATPQLLAGQLHTLFPTDHIEPEPRDLVQRPRPQRHALVWRYMGKS